MALTNPHKDRSHALLSASSASRWMNCTPSARLEDLEPEQTSEFAEEGTAAHELAEAMLLKHLDLVPRTKFMRKLKMCYNSKYYSPEMDRYVLRYVEFVEERFRVAQLQDPDAVILIEERLDYSHVAKEGFGTGDIVIVYDGLIEVIDLKYGKGVKVEAEDNSQLKLYGLAAHSAYELAYDLPVVRMTIVQPRLDHIASAEMKSKDLVEWGATAVYPKAEMAYRGDGERVTGSWCRFCKAQAKCPALLKEAEAIAKAAFDPVDNVPLETLIEMKESFTRIEKWMSEVNSHLTTEMLRGTKIEGYKLVEGISRRKWLDEQDVAQKMREEGWEDDVIYNKKVNSISALEKQMGKAAFNKILGKLVVKPKGKPTIAPSDDRRAEFSPDVDATTAFRD